MVADKNKQGEDAAAVWVKGNKMMHNDVDHEVSLGIDANAAGLN